MGSDDTAGCLGIRQADCVKELAADGTSLSEIARKLGIRKASVHRIVKAGTGAADEVELRPS